MLLTVSGAFVVHRSAAMNELLEKFAESFFYNPADHYIRNQKIVKVSKVMSDEDFLEDMKGSFKHKFAKKPEVIEGNMKALEMALKSIEKVD